MGLFDGIFDFNRDGKTGFGEELFGFGLLGAIIEEAEREEQEASLLWEDDLDEDDDF